MKKEELRIRRAREREKKLKVKYCIYLRNIYLPIFLLINKQNIVFHETKLEIRSEAKQHCYILKIASANIPHSHLQK